MVRYEPTGRNDDLATSRVFDELVARAVVSAGGTPFFAIAPLTHEVRANPAIVSRVSDVLLESGLGYLRAEREDVDAHIAHRRRCASYEEWLVGSCSAPFVKRPETRWFEKAVFWNSDVLCSQLERINCLAVYYGETGEALLWTAPFSGLEELIHA
jgi:hypothetical protein